MGDLVLFVLALLAPLSLSVCLYGLAKQRRSSAARAGWPVLLGGNALVLLWLASIVFLAGETYFRYVYDATDSYSQTRTSQRWFERHFERNNAQVRDSIHYAFARKPGRPRVTFIGDSFTAGHGVPNVEHRFANRIRLAKRGAWDVHVFAEAGRDTAEEIKLIGQLRQLHYDFDRVVLVYCLNDIADLMPEQQAIARRGEDRPGFLVTHSFLVNTYYYRLRARFDPLASGYYDHVLAAYEGPIWWEQRRRLEEFRDQCRAAGARVAVVLFPFVHALGPGNAYSAVHEQVRQACDSLEVPCLDLLPLFDEHRHEQLTVNRYDVHPNERAHEIAAEAIADFLDRAN